MSWAESTLGEEFELYQPKTLAKNELVTGGEYPVYGANGVIGFHNEFNHADPQVLVTCRGATCGTVNLSQANAWINGNAMVVKPKKSNVDLHFLKHYLIAGVDLNIAITGAAQPQITRQTLSPIKIKLPPLAEQKRIAAILDKADEIRRKRQQTIAKLDQLAQSIFVEMFGDLTAKNGHWPYGCINDFVAGFESGKSLVANDEDSDSKYKVLKVSAVTSLTFKPNECKSLPSGYLPPSSHFVKTGDLLFSRANTVDLIGATAFVYTTPNNLVLPDKLWRFVWHSPARAHPLFVRNLFQQIKFREQISKRSTGTSGSMKNISQNKVLSIPVSYPPLALQEQFANRIEKLEQLKADNLAALAKQTQLFASLQHQAFTGQL
jgi:type I restriction enzyme S subunit